MELDHLLSVKYPWSNYQASISIRAMECLIELPRDQFDIAMKHCCRSLMDFIGERENG